MGHGEYSSRKVDPQLDMGDLRRKVEQVLSGGGGSAASDEQFHVVQRGDTLSALARKYATTVDAIKALNHLSSDTIRVDQRLRVR
jgi:LysM repeat protein